MRMALDLLLAVGFTSPPQAYPRSRAILVDEFDAGPFESTSNNVEGGPAGLARAVGATTSQIEHRLIHRILQFAHGRLLGCSA